MNKAGLTELTAAKDLETLLASDVVAMEMLPALLDMEILVPAVKVPSV